MDTILRPKGMNVIDEEIHRLALKLKETDPTDENYWKIADNIKVLSDAREKKNDRTLSVETLANIAGNLIGLLLVLNFEKTGVITSKAFGLLWKSKS